MALLTKGSSNKAESSNVAACGPSKKQPFCDSSHKGTGIEPVSFVAAETGTVELCGCKQSGGKPYCDGTHENL